MSDETKSCVWFNRTWLAFTGRTLEEEIGDGWTSGVHPDDYDSCLATYVNAFERREPFSMEYRLQRHDGEYRWILDKGTPRYDEHDTFVGYIGSCLDITDERRQRDELARSTNRYQRLVETVDAIPWEYEIESDRWSYVAPQAERILGYAPGEWTDLDSWRRRIDDRDRTWASDLCASCIESGTSSTFEYRFRKKDGSTAWIRDTVDVEIESGQPARLRGAMIDVTAHRESEDAR
jgi:PAS domain S-box-containing protein